MIKKHKKKITSILFWTAIFALAYAQSPLFTSNQNQYFLHGLAKAGVGILSQDWLANALDSTPVFSFIVEWSYRIFRTENIFYFYYAGMMGVYLFSLKSIIETLFKINEEKQQFLLLTGITLIHSAGIHFFFSHFINPDWTFVLEGGVAGQRILGQVFQPSTVGIFLVLSIALFLKNKPNLAAIFLAITATIHPTYLFSAGIITISYLWIQWRETKSLKTSFRTGLIALVLVLPIVAYSIYVFLSGDISTHIDPQSVLVDLRIPHHAIPSEWVNSSIILQMFILIMALFVVRKKRIFPILFIPFVTATVLTLIVHFTANTTLALIFPWRVSSILMSISSSILFGWILIRLWNKYLSSWSTTHPKVYQTTLILILITLVSIGTIRFTIEATKKYTSSEREMQLYVKENHQLDDLYLVPINMQDFRLATGVPILVDFKSIPYYEADVLEWRTRLLNSSNFYKKALIDPEGCYLARHLNEGYGITHIVLPIELAGYVGTCWSQEPIYENEGFLILKIW